MTAPILFYSHKCPYCTKLMLDIQKKNIQGMLKFVCVDDVRAPPMITQVPTLVIKHCTKPMVGKDVFNWVNNHTFFNIPTNNINQGAANARPKVDSSLSYNRVGVSSKFTSLDDDNEEPLCLPNPLQTGYDHGVLKGYKDTHNDNVYTG
jgi:hypothetical protein